MEFNKIMRGIGYALRGLPLLVVLSGMFATYYAAKNNLGGIKYQSILVFVVIIALWAVGLFLTRKFQEKK